MLKEEKNRILDIEFWNFAEYSKILLKCKREIKTSLANKLKKKGGNSLLLELLLLLLLELPTRALEVLPAERKKKNTAQKLGSLQRKEALWKSNKLR